MSANLFWFDDEQWSKVMPHLPTNQQGPERHDDRRILELSPNFGDGRPVRRRRLWADGQSV